jgi:serine/threonine protein kinase
MNPNINNNNKVDSEELPKECYRAEWQSFNYPTCNDIYEIDLPNMIRMAPRKYYHDTGRLYHGTNTNSNSLSNNYTVVHANSHMGYVAQGFWRSVWAVYPPRRDIISSNHQSTSGKAVEPNVVVLKTMRRSHDLSTRNYERHRRDAIVMEQLTSSPYVMDIYGFCGNSVLTEYMDLTLEDIAFDDSQYPIIDMDNGDAIAVTSTKRIQMALDMVRGVQAIHEISGGPIVHADLQAKQFLISRSTGTVKINDFNRCRFMASKSITRTESDQDVITNAINDSGTNLSRTIATTTVPCKFFIPSAPGTSRSPEEYMENELDEKIDVYAVGHVLYNLLSYREAWDGYHTITAQQRMMNGEIPNMDRFIRDDDTHNHTGSPAATISHALSDLPIHIQQWYINITKQAYTFDPTERVSASALALELEAMLEEINGHL